MQRIQGLMQARLGLYFRLLAASALSVLAVLAESVRPLFAWNPQASVAQTATRRPGPGQPTRLSLDPARPLQLEPASPPFLTEPRRANAGCADQLAGFGACRAPITAPAVTAARPASESSDSGSPSTGTAARADSPGTTAIIKATGCAPI
jgi:hypothetical protein